jgi:hypothetical protein
MPFRCVSMCLMTMDERLEAMVHSVELLASMQQTTEKNLNCLTREVRLLLLASMQQTTEKNLQATEKNLNCLTREVRLFRQFVLLMGVNIESRLLNLEGDPEKDGPAA